MNIDEEENKKDLSKLSKEEVEKYYNEIVKQMDNIKKEFEENTIQDIVLQEHFKDNDLKDKYQKIRIAGTILGGIDLRNLQRKNNNLQGEKEIYPYNAEQIKMIDKYFELEDIVDEIERYAELNFEVEDVEM